MDERGDCALVVSCAAAGVPLLLLGGTNDGACDADGRFFAGTICNKEHNIPGQLYCYDPSIGTTTLVDPGPFTVSTCLHARQIP